MTQIYTSPDTGKVRTYTFRQLKSKSFKFQIKANANVNLCLSPTYSEVPHQQFEIFLGGWGGGESAIRRNKKDDVCRVKTPNVLSPGQFMGFWIVITPHAIKVGKEGQGTPFLIHSDPSVTFNLSYYGYCTNFGTTGYWKFSDDDWGALDMGAVGAAIEDLLTPAHPPPPYSPPSAPVMSGSGSLYQLEFGRKHRNLPAAQRKCKITFSPENGQDIKWVQCTSVSSCPSPLKVDFGPNGAYVATAYHNGGLIPGVVMPPNFNVCHVPWGGEAVARTDFYLLSSTGTAQFVWQPAARGNVPVGAIQGGYSENGEPLYIGRFRQAGNFISGKVQPSHQVCYIPYWGKETANASYEVLCLKTIPLSVLGI